MKKKKDKLVSKQKKVKIKEIKISESSPIISAKIPGGIKKATIKFEPSVTQQKLLQRQVLEEQMKRDQKFRSILNQKNVYFKD